MPLKRLLKDRRTWMRLRLDLIADPIYGGRGSILALHRVRPAGEAARMSFNRRLEITPEELESCIIGLRRRRFEFVSMDEVPARLTRKSGRRFVAVTLDDGYRDNLRHAYPLFRKHGIPFTVYVANCFPNGTAVMWWYLLELLLQSTDRVRASLDAGDLDLPASTDTEKEEAFSTLGPMLAFASTVELKQRLDALVVDWRERSRELVRDHALSWSEVAQLGSDEHVTIGAHTLNHLPLSRLSDSEVRSEVTGSREELEERSGKPVRHFAYPYGGRAACGPREFALVNASGFTTGVTTRQGNLFREHIAFPSALPRLGITSDVLRDGASGLALLTSGLIPCHENRFARVITD
jgi:peptidoglycan/xylan/chitin deacetylase (PgdA/CDA1 family)